jgi:V/A-type H+-transporting ATPase subunit E
LTTFLKNKTLNSLNKGVTIEIDSKTKTGFKIAPLNGNYTISFNENDFENFFKSYFRERTKKLLFESES